MIESFDKDKITLFWMLNMYLGNLRPIFLIVTNNAVCVCVKNNRCRAEKQLQSIKCGKDNKNGV